MKKSHVAAATAIHVITNSPKWALLQKVRFKSIEIIIDISYITTPKMTWKYWSNNSSMILETRQSCCGDGCCECSSCGIWCLWLLRDLTYKKLRYLINLMMSSWIYIERVFRFPIIRPSASINEYQWTSIWFLFNIRTYAKIYHSCNFLFYVT